MSKKPLQPFSVIKQKAKKFMTTAEIEDLGLPPFNVSAYEWRKAGNDSWVPEQLPDHAKAVSFCMGTEDPNVIDTIVIWNLDTFDSTGLNLDQ